MKWLIPKDERDLGFVRDEDEEEPVPMTPLPNFVEVKVQAEDAPAAGPWSKEDILRKEKGKTPADAEERIPTTSNSAPKESVSIAEVEKDR
ncbi:hypothetical protein R1flu_026489 [Riccia fluitans]|uniref:Uncharacterized protein n=1 Tax=Riccia fluitans TaxID=41844 RepID=A0ABD1XJ31_9MARC